jgi:hypothetical protein
VVNTYWVSNGFNTGHIAPLRAKRVPIISDSCYAGLLSSAPKFFLIEQKSRLDREFLEFKARRQARLLLSSGGDSPALDSGIGEHWVFAGACHEVGDFFFVPSSI